MPPLVTAARLKSLRVLLLHPFSCGRSLCCRNALCSSRMNWATRMARIMAWPMRPALPLEVSYIRLSASCRFQLRQQALQPRELLLGSLQP